MLAEPFEPFNFSPADADVYQLGPFGTAAKKLEEWDLKPSTVSLDYFDRRPFEFNGKINKVSVHLK
jgi:hypothetical protein